MTVGIVGEREDERAEWRAKPGTAYLRISTIDRVMETTIESALSR